MAMEWEDRRVAVVFPGQGAQAPGLGAAWKHDEAWRVVERAEAATGVDFTHLLLDAPAEALTRTREAQLVVLGASLLAWEAARPHIAAEVKLVSGHSLGLVTALVAAGALDFDDGVRLAVRRAELTQQCADAGDHAMAAFLGASPDVVEDVCAGADCWVANDNGGGQVVVAGTRAGVAEASARAKGAGVKRVIPLNVGGAFHTPLMQPAADAFAADLAATTFRPPAVPVVCNTDGAVVASADEWRRRLVDHLVNPVRWRAVLASLSDAGVSTLVEVGPGTTLVNLAKREVPHMELRSIGTPADVPAVAAEVSA